MPLRGYSQQSLKGHGNWGIARKPMSLLPSKQARKVWVIKGWSTSSHFQEKTNKQTTKTTFYKEITNTVEDGRKLNVIYLDFIRAFNTISHNILIDKVIKYGPHKWTVEMY